MPYQLLDLSEARGKLPPAASGGDLTNYIHCLNQQGVQSPAGLLVWRTSTASSAGFDLDAVMTRELERLHAAPGGPGGGLPDLRLSWWHARSGLPDPAAPGPSLDLADAAGAAACIRRYLDAQPLPEGAVLMVQAHPDGDPPLIVFSTRSPLTGLAGPVGEYGQPEGAAVRIRGGRPLSDLEPTNRGITRRLARLGATVEAVFGEMAEVEALVLHGTLWLVGARRGSPGPRAALRQALDRVSAGVWTRARGVSSLSSRHIEALLRPAPRAGELERLPVLGTGRGASAGIVSGAAVLSVPAARRLREAGRRSVLFAATLVPEELGDTPSADAVVLLGGGVSTRTAAWARREAVPLVCCVEGLVLHRDSVCVGDECCDEGTWLTVDGSRGVVYVGEPRLSRTPMGTGIRRILDWADELNRQAGLEFRVNADDAGEARQGLALGAAGVGLCRTERMLSRPSHRGALLRYAQARGTKASRTARRRLVAAYRSELRALFVAARGAPVTVRLLDPSLDEAGILGPGATRLAGCRVGLVRPEIYDAQVEALLEAAVSAARSGRPVRPEILIPQVNTVGELTGIRARVERIRRMVADRAGSCPSCLVGAMIETPRGALVAASLALHADFLCFGTNDLTQYTMGIPREGRRGRPLVGGEDPFRHLDVEGVGVLLRRAALSARRARPDLPLGVCGEHAGEPVSIARMLEPPAIPLSYLSCSPARLPLARHAAARARQGAG